MWGEAHLSDLGTVVDKSTHPPTSDLAVEVSEGQKLFSLFGRFTNLVATIYQFSLASRMCFSEICIIKFAADLPLNFQQIYN